MNTPDCNEDIILLADLSLPTSSVSDLFEAIRCSLSWQYGEDSALSLKAINLRNPKEALVFLDSTSVAERLTSESIIHLSGPLTASFRKVGNAPTEYIHIQIARDIQLNHIIREIKGLNKPSTDIPTPSQLSFFYRRSSILVKLPSPEVAENIQQKLSGLNGIQSSEIVTTKSFSCVECFWKSNISLNEAVSRLRRSGQSLLDLIGSYLCLLEEQPGIIDVSVISCTSQSTRNSTIDLVIICCTEKDADIVRSYGRIELGMIGCITIAHSYDTERGSEKSDASVLSSESTIDTSSCSNMNTPTSSSRGFSFKELYVFWDVMNCPLSVGSDADDAATITNSLLDTCSCAFGNDCNFQLATTTKFIFLAHDPGGAYKPTSKQLHDLVDMHYRVIGYVRRSGPDSAIKGEVTAMIRRHCGDETKPAVCLITGGGEVSGVLDSLLAEGFHDTLLIHNSRKTVASKVPKSLPWSVLRQLHQMSSQDKSCLLSFNFEHPDYQNILNKYMLEGECLSDDMSAKLIPTSMEVALTRSLRISRFSMAAHLSNLIKWKEEESIHGGTLPGAENIDDHWANFDTDSCQVEVSIDRDRRKQKVIITGSSEEEVKARFYFVESTLVTLAQNRKILRMHGWQTHHREAMMGSLPLGTKGQAFRTTVVFHVTDGQIVAEIISVSEIGISKMTDYLKGLEPIEAEWQFDPKNLIPEPRVRFWNSLRNKYAVMFDKVLQNNRLCVKAWGFEGMMEEASRDILSASQGQMNPSSTAASTVPLLHHPPKNRLTGDKGEPIHIALYTFKDKDAGLFYVTYEEMFQRYFANVYHVSVTPVSSFIGVTSDTANAIKNGFLVVDIRGKEDDIIAATKYMDSIRSNIYCHELHLSKIDAKRFKDICDMKDSFLSGQIAEAIKTSNLNEDPLGFRGLICIRVSPAVVPKGSKKVSFPTDVDIFVSESAVTTCNHGHGDGYSSKISRILRKFSDFNAPSIHQDPGFRLSDDSISITSLDISEGSKMYLPSISQSASPHGVLISPKSETYTDLSTPSPRVNFTDVMRPAISSAISGTPFESAPPCPTCKQAIRWPHSSFRYMFLAENMKTRIHTTVELIKSKFGDSVVVTCPYRDKKDASVCLLVEGPQDGVEFGAKAFDEMLARVLEELTSVKLILSDSQYDKLTTMDLATVKAIQGSAGVHFMLTPSSSEISSAPRSVDLRTLQPRLASSSDTILCRLPSFNKRPVDLSVISTSAESEGWTWGVNCLFVILERDDDCGLSPQEAEKLNHGEVLVTTDFDSGKTILRARATCPMKRGHHELSMSTEQLLVSAIGRGLAQADILGMLGMAIVTPDSLNAFATLSTERIQSLTASSVVEYVRTHQVFSLERIVCLDVKRPDVSPFKSVVQCSYMAESLCRIVKDMKDSSFPVCNDPVCSVLLGHKAPSARGNRDTVAHSLILKGTESGLDTAIEEVKEAITS